MMDWIYWIAGAAIIVFMMMCYAIVLAGKRADENDPYNGDGF